MLNHSIYELQRLNDKRTSYLYHSNVKGSKWGYTKGKRNGNRTALEQLLNPSGVIIETVTLDEDLANAAEKVTDLPIVTVEKTIERTKNKAEAAAKIVADGVAIVSAMIEDPDAFDMFNKYGSNVVKVFHDPKATNKEKVAALEKAIEENKSYDRVMGDILLFNQYKHIGNKAKDIGKGISKAMDDAKKSFSDIVNKGKNKLKQLFGIK